MKVGYLLTINSKTDTDWEGAHLVYVPYCSSDAHMGDSEHEVAKALESMNSLVRCYSSIK